MRTTCSSETSLKFQRTTRIYIPEDSLLIVDYGLHLLYLQTAARNVAMRYYIIISKREEGQLSQHNDYATTTME
jgi:hypothetical protein